ncbi:Uncharacterised protein [Klebsiella pneumoniae subsp. pneumoniae]|nr:Uncharacterised protein [Klebsiella pneumoniae subsp. pneumoniae]
MPSGQSSHAVGTSLSFRPRLPASRRAISGSLPIRVRLSLASRASGGELSAEIATVSVPRLDEAIARRNFRYRLRVAGDRQWLLIGAQIQRRGSVHGKSAENKGH